MSEKLLAGVGRIDITPELGVRLGGYAVENRPAESVNDHLSSTALVFKQGNLKAVLINLDWLGIMEKQVDDIRSRITNKTGIPGENVIISTIHSHTAPNTINIPGWGELEMDYINNAVPKIIDSVVEADNNLKEIKVGIGTTLSKAGVNRRAIDKNNSFSFSGDPLGNYDPNMTVIRLETNDEPLATIIHYGAHATAFGSKKIVSRDWPGVMVDRVESQTGSTVLFINGPIGDVGPRTNVLNMKNKAFSAGGGDGIESIREVGYRAATDALNAYINIKTLGDNLKLDLITETILLKYATLPSLESAKEKIEEYKEHKGSFGSGAYEFQRWQNVINEHKNETPSPGKEYVQTILRLGSVAIVPFPGELFSGISLRLRKWSPFQHTLCLSVSNGYYTYIPTREAIHREGYEVWMAKAYNGYGLDDNIDDSLVEQNLELLQKLEIKGNNYGCI